MIDLPPTGTEALVVSWTIPELWRKRYNIGRPSDEYAPAYFLYSDQQIGQVRTDRQPPTQVQSI